MSPARADRLLFTGLFAAVAGLLIARAITTAGQAPLLADTDDAMRLTVVRDFLAGQGWYDLVQHRLNTPFGAEIHWSRLIDLPLAGLLLALRPLFGPMAETVLLVGWPILLLGLLMTLSGALTTDLCGREGLLAGLVLPVLAPAILAEFLPGRIDHHNVLLILTLALALASVKAVERPAPAILAGMAAAAGLTIGIEALPMAAAAILVFGLLWVLDAGKAAALRLFGVGFAITAAIGLALTRPPQRWLEPACDMISASYAGAALAVGAGLVLLSLLPLGGRGPWVRLGAGVLAGSAVAGVLALAFPACLAGPYGALDPDLAAHWLPRIAEAQPIWVAMRSSADFILVAGLPILVALVVAGVAIARNRDAARARWLVLAVLLCVAALTAMLQIRGIRTAAALAAPASAALIAFLRARYLAGRDWRAAALLLGTWLLNGGMLLLILIGALSGPAAPSEKTATEASGKPAGRRDCLLTRNFEPLRALPAQRVMAPVDLGSHILAETGHSVVGAPYHRNQQGVIDTLRFFNGPSDAAAAILAARGVSLVVVCTLLPEMKGFADAAPDALVRLLAEDKVPAWLSERAGGPGPLRLFDVVGATGPVPP